MDATNGDNPIHSSLDKFLENYFIGGRRGQFVVQHKSFQLKKAVSFSTLRHLVECHLANSWW